jgi:hypothetical protein
MNTANWIPDLFMKRVMEKGEWTLFSPSDVPDLHDKFGKAFESAYLAYEAKAASGEIELSRKSRRSTCGAKCCPCCLKQDIHGSRSKILAISAARSSM